MILPSNLHIAATASTSKMASDGSVTDELRAFSERVKAEGCKGVELFEKIATRTVEIKESGRTNRCPRCWHDEQTRCICRHVPPLAESSFRLPVKVIILMHYREYLSAGNDAKLLLALLPGQEQRSKLYIFGRTGDWEKFQQECSIDPDHTLLLWPAEKALTVDGFVSQLPDDSPWKQRHERIPHYDTSGENDPHEECNLPTLRVIILDGVYSQARNMFKSLKKRFAAASVPIPPHVALHPKTLSVYHRAQKNYAKDSAVSVRNSSDPEALHICSVEAFALLLKEFGESDDATTTLVKAVEINNLALVHDLRVRPPASKTEESIDSE